LATWWALRLWGGGALGGGQQWHRPPDRAAGQQAPCPARQGVSCAATPPPRQPPAPPGEPTPSGACAINRTSSGAPVATPAGSTDTDHTDHPGTSHTSRKPRAAALPERVSAPHARRWPATGPARPPEVCAPCWIQLFPLFPLKNGLFPHPVGTEFFNGDNDLRAFLRSVPTVPTKKERPPEGNSKKRGASGALAPHFLRLSSTWWRSAGHPKVLPGGTAPRVCSAAHGGKLNRRPWGVVLLPAVPGASPAARHPGSDPHPTPPCWVLRGVAVYGSFTARDFASLCSGKRVYGERCTVDNDRRVLW
jgi:hypothetical protein